MDCIIRIIYFSIIIPEIAKYIRTIPWVSNILIEILLTILCCIPLSYACEMLIKKIDSYRGK